MRCTCCRSVHYLSLTAYLRSISEPPCSVQRPWSSLLLELLSRNMACPLVPPSGQTLHYTKLYLGGKKERKKKKSNVSLKISPYWTFCSGVTIHAHMSVCQANKFPACSLVSLVWVCQLQTTLEHLFLAGKSAGLLPCYCWVSNAATSQANLQSGSQSESQA